MHAVVVTANINPAQVEGARKHLREVVVPRVKSAPGLVKGYWSLRADSANGLSLIVFDTKEHADGTSDMVRNAPASGRDFGFS